MKSFFRFFGLFILAGIAVVITFGGLFYYNSDWQKSVLLDVLKKDKEREYSIGSVSIKRNSVYLTDVFVLQGEQGMEVKEFGVEMSFLKLFQHEIDVERGLVEGLIVDLSRLYQGDPTAADWVGFVERLKNDPEFWRQRMGQLIANVSKYGYQVELENIFISGVILLPYSEQVDLNLYLSRASSEDLEGIDLTVMNGGGPVLTKE